MVGLRSVAIGPVRHYSILHVAPMKRNNAGNLKLVSHWVWFAQGNLEATSLRNYAYSTITVQPSPSCQASSHDTTRRVIRQGAQLKKTRSHGFCGQPKAVRPFKSSHAGCHMLVAIILIGEACQASPSQSQGS